jgi:alkanesulfonate monooxygenase SsuD/methylene tetrahydromethanopterin reductase-like flavin-dependent oxidoreductase (luciferase family)
MKFGVFFLLHSPNVEDTATVYRRALNQATYADDLGFDSAWFAEHHFSTYGYCPNPLMMAVKAAQVTKHVRLGTAVIVLPFWNPLRLAEEIAMADVLTEGRLDVGVARGYQKYEFDRLGLDINDSRSLSDETLDILIEALNTDSFSHQGQHYSFPETTIYPRSVQQPHPPIWLAAATKESIENAVHRGLNCFTSSSTRPINVVQAAWDAYSAATLSADSAQKPLEFAVQQHVHVAETDAEAAARMDASIWHYRISNRLRSATERVERGVAFADPIDGEPTSEDLFATHTVAGNPATVCAKLQAYVDTVGMTQLNCIFSLGALDDDTVRSSMKLFAEKVMPQFK